jgi:hypothetical protein
MTLSSLFRAHSRCETNAVIGDDETNPSFGVRTSDRYRTGIGVLVDIAKKFLCYPIHQRRLSWLELLRTLWLPVTAELLVALELLVTLELSEPRP